MNAFLVELSNKPGELARLAEAVAAKRINITAISGSAFRDGGTVGCMTSDDAATRDVLKSAGFTFREIEAVETSLKHEPGTLAKAARRLADAGINVEAILATGMEDGHVMVAFVTADPAKAKQLLAGATASA